MLSLVLVKYLRLEHRVLSLPPTSWHASSTHTFSYSFTIVELGLVIGKGGRDISQANAESHIAGYSMSVFHNPNKREVGRLTMHTYSLLHASSYPPLSRSGSLMPSLGCGYDGSESTGQGQETGTTLVCCKRI